MSMVLIHYIADGLFTNELGSPSFTLGSYQSFDASNKISFHPALSGVLYQTSCIVTAKEKHTERYTA